MFVRKIYFILMLSTIIGCRNIGYKEIKISEQNKDATILFFNLTDIVNLANYKGYYFAAECENEVLGKIHNLKKQYVLILSREQPCKLEFNIFNDRNTPFVGYTYTSTQNYLNPEKFTTRFIHPFNNGESYFLKKGQILSLKFKLDEINVIKPFFIEHFLGILSFPLAWPLGTYPLRKFQRLNYDLFEDSSELINDVSKKKYSVFGKLNEITTERILKFSSNKPAVIGDILHLVRNNKTFAKVIITRQDKDLIEAYLVSILPGEQVYQGDNLVKLNE